MEHRWGQRIATDVPVSLVGTPAAIGVGRILNASTTGALVQTRLPLPLLSVVYLEWAEPNLGPSGRLIGCVVRHSESEIGIEWCDADSDAVLQLLAALRDDSPLRSAHLGRSRASSARVIPRETSRNNLISAASNTCDSRLPSSRYALASPRRGFPR
jgi:hypothetical protein